MSIFEKTFEKYLAGLSPLSVKTGVTFPILPQSRTNAATPTAMPNGPMSPNGRKKIPKATTPGAPTKPDISRDNKYWRRASAAAAEEALPH